MKIKDLVIDDRGQGIFRVHRSSITSVDQFQRERKLLVENSLYGNHLEQTHQTFLDYNNSLGTGDSEETMATRLPGGARALGNGYCVIETPGRNGRPIAH